ncbi:MAG: glycosyltransferase family 39 protein, partial [Anaerolineae bacterium]|nr:glycosyltransferase family 39 protein [Anaerolineae bacterium]
MNSRKPPRRAWVVLIVLGAFALRVWQLDVQSLWFDELVAVYAASQPLPEIPAADPSNPPLYFILLHGWLALAGASPFAIRLLPALLGTLLVAGVWALGRRQGGPATGLLAAALAAISPLLWWYAQEGRMYTLMALEVLALIFLVDRLARRPGDRRAWLAAFVIEAAALFTHNLGAAVAAWFNLAVMGAWLYRRRWRVLARWLAVQAVLGAALLPWLVWRGQLVYSLANPTYAPPDLSALLGAWAALWAGSWTLVGAEPGFVQLTWLLLALVGVGAAAARRAGAPKLLAHVALIVAPGMIFLAVGRFAYHPRYFVVAAAPALALAAMGAVGLARARRAVGPLLAAALVTLALGLSGYALHRINTTPAYGRDDARGLADYYRRVLAPGDVVVVPYAYAREYTLWYYGVPDGVEVVELDSAGFDAAYAALSARLGASDAVRVEVMDWDKAFGDRRGVLDCLLMGSGRRLGEPFRVVGLGTQGYEIRAPLMLPPALPPAQPVEADFGAFRLTGAAFMAGGPADRARCVVLDWQLAAPVDYGAAAALTVTNALGWEIARADAPLLRDDFAPASLWEAGQTVQGFAVVQLPPDTPPGDYALRVRVYRTDTLQALDWRID